MTRARLGRYALWQLRDYVFERGLPTLIVAALLLLPLVEMAHAARRARAGAQMTPGSALNILAELFTGVLSFVLVLLATNGIVANDRKHGYYRFLFAKPASIPRFYAQSFAVNFVGAMLTTLVILFAFAALVTPVFSLGALAFAALYYLALGGIMFLVSTLTRLDWVVTAAIWGAAQVLRAMYPPQYTLVGRIADVLLPPAHRISAVGHALIGGSEAAALPLGSHDFTVSVLWLAGWGLAAFVTGLVVLRRRAMGGG